MQREIKTLDGIMSLDESNDVVGNSHHKEARNGVFKGNAPEMAFTGIRGNKKVTNASLQTTACRIAGTATYIPNCNIAGNAQIYVPNCDLVGSSVLRSCNLAGNAVLISLLPVWTLQSLPTCIDCVSTDVFRDTNPDSPSYLHYRVNGIDIGLTPPVLAYCDILPNWVAQGGTVCQSCVAYPILRDMNPCSPTTGKYKVNETIYETAPSPLACNTTQILRSEGVNYCFQCENIDIKKDTNPCSPTYLHYFINGFDVGENSPTTGDCFYDPILVSQGYTTCSACTNQTVYRDTNPCSTTYLQYKVGASFVGLTAPEDVDCNGSPILVSAGYSTCWLCETYPVTINTNPCSLTYNHYYILGEDQGTTAPEEFVCTTDANWVLQSFTTCVSCVNTDVYRDMNSCSPTGGKYRIGLTGTPTSTAPSSALCNVTPNWVDQGYTTCYFCVDRQVFRDTNPCSPSYNHYRVNGVDQGTTAPTNALCNTGLILTTQLYSTCFACTTYTVFKNTNPCSATYNHYYVGGEDQGTTAPADGACNLTATWTLQSFQTCVSCVNTDVYRDTNSCSPTAGNYRVNGVNVGSSSPSPGTCYTGVTLTSQGYTTCSGCINRTVFRDTNPCSSTYNNYYVNGVNVGSGQPTPAPCNTGRLDVDQGYTTCISCVNYTVYRDNNPCSPTYNYYFANSTNLGTSAPSSASCNTSASWTVVFGTFTCSSCGKYAVEKDLNPCSPTYNQTRQGGLVESNSTYCYVAGVNCCGQSTAAVWTNTGAFICTSCVSYAEQRDTNVCSPTYNQTRAVIPGGSACNTTANYVNDGSNTICMGYDLHQRTIDNNPCSPSYGMNGVGALIQSNSATCGYTTTTFNGFLSLVGPGEACATGEYGQISIQVIGSNLCDCTKVISLPSFVWADMFPDDEFWIVGRVSATFRYRKFRRDGSANTATPIESCGLC